MARKEVMVDVQPLPHRADDGPEIAEAIQAEAEAHAAFVAETGAVTPLRGLVDQINANALSLADEQASPLQIIAELQMHVDAARPLDLNYLARVLPVLKSALENEEIRASELVTLATNVG